MALLLPFLIRALRRPRIVPPPPPIPPHKVAYSALEALERSLGAPVEAVIGHSFGGKVALELARRAVELDPSLERARRLAMQLEQALGGGAG